MRGGAAERQWCANTHRGHHVPHLADDVVAQQPTNVILKDSIDNAVNGHGNTRPDQKFTARKYADQQVDSGLGSKRAQKHGSSN